MIKAEDIVAQMQKVADHKESEHSQRFFKTGKGEYGEGDVFIGLKTPLIRDLVKKNYRDLSLNELEKLIKSPYHEARAFTVLVLTKQFAKAKPEQQKIIVDFYLKNINRINNWDLIDLSVHKVLGPYCCSINDFSILYKLSESGHLWSERASLVANWYIVKQGNYDIIKTLSVKFINHPHDLIHKATGWMLREMGKQDEAELCTFLDQYATRLPRTALRYALERLSLDKKQYYMKKKD